MSNKQRKAAEGLKKVASQTEDFIKSISGSSEHLASKNSSVLYGVIGALIGSLFGIGSEVIFPFLEVIDKMMVSGALTGLGAAIGILVYRGKNRIKMEKFIEAERIIHDEIINKINSLPPDAPKELRREYYDSLSQLNKSYVQSGKILIELPKRKLKKLPSPNDDG